MVQRLLVERNVPDSYYDAKFLFQSLNIQSNSGNDI